MNNPYYYKGANPTVDLIIINPHNQILLIKRSDTSPACPGMWAIPGGFIDTDAKKNEYWKEGLETPELAAIREVKEETNLKLDNPELKFIGIFEGNNRDPRDNQESWSKSYAFIHVIPKDVYEEQKDKIIGLDDASSAEWKNIDDIKNMKLAFDHSLILNEGLKILEGNKKKPKLK